MTKKATYFDYGGAVLAFAQQNQVGYAYGAPAQPISFAGLGAVATPPTTSFFGAIPDRLNALVPAHQDASNDYQITTQLNAGDHINQWVPYNTSYTGGANAVTISLGGMTTAPDGTNTAQKIVEAATNSRHYMTAAYFAASAGAIARLAVFAKAAERTRIALQFASGIETTEVRTIFDLSNGVVAVAGTTHGSPFGIQFTPVADTIIPFGNGWYCCMIDVLMNFDAAAGVRPPAMAFCMTDSGSGNAAESISYVGDGSSGVYTWRATALPTGVWGMTGQRVLFEDFNDNTMSNFDLTDARDPTKTWFIHSVWPFDFGTSPISAGGLSVSSSVLTMTNTGSGLGLGTAGWQGSNNLQPFPNDVWAVGTTYAINRVIGFDPTNGNTALYISLQNGNVGNQPDISPTFWALYSGPGNAIPPGGPSYVGQGYTINPGLMECRQTWVDSQSFWANAIPSLMCVQGFNNNKYGAPYNVQYLEQDFTETFPGTGFFSESTIIQGECITNAGEEYGLHIMNFRGYPLWKSTPGYQQNTIVGFGGVLYQSSVVGDNIGNQPDISPSKWNVFTPSAPFASVATTIIFDLSQFHTFSILNVPATKTSCGQSLAFMDGLITLQPADHNLGNVTNWGPTVGNAIIGYTTGWQLSEGVPFVIFLRNVNTTVQFDWVSVTH